MEIKGMNKIDVGMLPPSNGTFIEWGGGGGGAGVHISTMSPFCGILTVSLNN